jgi:hypothetical protein
VYGEADTFLSQDAKLKMNHSDLALYTMKANAFFLFYSCRKTPKLLSNQGMQATAIKISGEACH